MPHRARDEANHVTETVAAIVAAHRTKTMTPAQTVARSYQRIREHNDPAVFISLRDEKEALAEAARLADPTPPLPLYGVPVAVKDNIDVAGLPTTAACPAFAYTPAARLDRGRQDCARPAPSSSARPISTSSPPAWSACARPTAFPAIRCAAIWCRADRARARRSRSRAGLVPLALGTDTAGSGRVPAMLNNIVGLKPSLGLIPNTGLVPACRTLDCISVFSLTVDDALAALAVMAGPDERRSVLARPAAGALTTFPAKLKLGIPQVRPADLLRRSRGGEGLWRSGEALADARRRSRRVRSRAVL